MNITEWLSIAVSLALALGVTIVFAWRLTREKDGRCRSFRRWLKDLIDVLFGIG